jgi:hypothetical protein
MDDAATSVSILLAVTVTGTVSRTIKVNPLMFLSSP